MSHQQPFHCLGRDARRRPGRAVAERDLAGIGMAGLQGRSGWLMGRFCGRAAARAPGTRRAHRTRRIHRARCGRGLARRLGLERLTDDDEVDRAVTDAPVGTRAFFRGGCLARFASQIVAANWDSLVFDTGAPALRRVPMLEPTRGTEEHVGELLATAASAADLLDRLGR